MKKEVEQEKEESNQVKYNDFPNIKNDVSLVKINSNLFNVVAEIVESDCTDYPSIKKFIEVAVKNQINLIKYNIENRFDILTTIGNLKTNSMNEFTTCLTCNRLFLNDREKSKKGIRVCPNCVMIIKKLSNMCG